MKEKVLSEIRSDGLIMQRVLLKDVLLRGEPVVMTRIIDPEFPFDVPHFNFQGKSGPKRIAILGKNQ